MTRVLHCLTCRCVLYGPVAAANHELTGCLVVSYPEPEKKKEDAA